MSLLRRNRDPALHSYTDEDRKLARRKATLAAGLLILTGCTASTSSSAADSNTSAAVSSSPSGSSAPKGPRWETQEFGAYAFEQLIHGQTVAGAKVFIHMGDKVLALCRIPPDGTEDKSFHGGFYIIRSPSATNDGLIKVGQRVVTSANTFVNEGPDSAYDPNIVVCTPQQDASVGYQPTGEVTNENNPIPVTPANGGIVVNALRFRGYYTGSDGSTQLPNLFAA